MRFSLITLMMAAGIAAAAEAPKAVTYLRGNVEGFSQNDSATLTLPNTKVLVLKSKSTVVEIPYADILKTDRVTQPVATSLEPIYKVWTLKDRLMPPPLVQELTVQYVTQNGNERTITIEMEKKTVEKVMKYVNNAAARNARDHGAWWGDQVWKTNRNKDQWGNAGPVAQRLR